MITVIPLEFKSDNRGWLTELFRDDEGFNPEMGYLSLTEGFLSRGPHQHEKQTDCFIFMNGKVIFTYWYIDKKGREIKESIEVGKDNPVKIIVPPKVIHGYRNLEEDPCLIFNFPDKLYAGKNKLEPVDEVRYENNVKYILD